jgi:CubicO group peptidase (beta-lactamase class C family)
MQRFGVRKEGRVSGSNPSSEIEGRGKRPGEGIRGLRDDWVSAYEAYAKRVVDEFRIPGIGIGLARGGELRHFFGFGHRDAHGEKPVTPDTIFGIGSITKSFTCVAVMKLQEAGKLSVHDPVVKYLPEFRTPDASVTKKITIEHFMTHTSGLPPLRCLLFALARSMEKDPIVSELEEARKKHDIHPIDTYEDLLKFLAEEKYELLGPPGTHFSYSNDAYSLLGAIVERASGQRYEDYVRDHILRPAGMTRSCFDLAEFAEDDDVTTLFATKKTEAGEEIVHAPVWWEAPAMVPAGFLRMSARDLLRYAEIFRNHGRVGDVRILSPESVKAMLTPRVSCGARQWYGYGLIITPNYHGVTLVEHGGDIKGVAAQMMVVPEEGITAVGLANLGGAPTVRLTLAAVNGALGLPVETPRLAFADAPLPAERLMEYDGTYASEEGAVLRAVVESGALHFEMEGKRFPARPIVHPDAPGKGDAFAFAFRGEEMFAEFLRSPEGKVYAVQLGFRTVRRVPDEAA